MFIIYFLIFNVMKCYVSCMRSQQSRKPSTNPSDCQELRPKASLTTSQCAEVPAIA